MSRRLFAAAALSAALAVIAGAFGAHGASGRAVEWLRTGGQYELTHAIGAMVALQQRARVAAILLLAGSLVFALTLYAMAFGGPLWLGAVTPLGGLGMIAGWGWLARHMLLARGGK